MKNWIVFKRKYEGAVHGSVSREEWDMMQMFAPGAVELVAEADTQQEAADMAQGFDAIDRVGEICDLWPHGS